MNRINGAVGLVLLLVAALSVGEAQAKPPAGRNILLIISDDVGVDVSAFYPLSADRRVTSPPAPPTPNLAGLAARGILFRRAWVTPWCSPSRAELMTGRYPFRTGVGIAINPPGEAPTPQVRLSEFSLAEAVTRARPGAYHLAHIGKWHLSNGIRDPNLQGWTYFAGPDPAYSNLDSYSSWRKTVNGVSTVTTTYPTTDQVNETIGQIAAAKAERKPYLIWLAFNAPHAPYQKPPDALYAYAQKPLPATGASPRAYYEAMLEAMDTEIGRLMQAVDLKTTTVIYLGDNGTPNAVTVKPYAIGKGKSHPYEQGTRVPLLIAGAGVAKPGRVVQEIVSGVDLYPTILALAGIDPAAALPPGTVIDGVSILPYLKGRTDPPVRDFAYTEEFDSRYDQGYERAIRDCCTKLIERQGSADEFYDLTADPYEARNLLRAKPTATQKAEAAALAAQIDDLLATAP